MTREELLIYMITNNNCDNIYCADCPIYDTSEGSMDRCKCRISSALVFLEEHDETELMELLL